MLTESPVHKPYNSQNTEIENIAFYDGNLSCTFFFIVVTATMKRSMKQM